MARSKRKRSSSRTSEASEEFEPSAPRWAGNPFLSLGQSQERVESPEKMGKNGEDLFSMVVMFLEHTRKRKIGNDDNQGTVDAPESDVSNVARRLLVTLSNEASSVKQQQGIISTRDIADLLLPWAIKGVLRSSTSAFDRTTRSMDLEWQILSECTKFLLESKTNDQVVATKSQGLSSHFSLSTLHKLVALAGSLALTDPDDVTDSTGGGEMAAMCYCLWVEYLYRPPFDTVCGSLLPLIGERVPSDPGLPVGIRHAKMTLATLELLQETLKKANPKKAFQSLVRLNTLSSLSNIFATSGESAQVLVRALIDDGIYNLEHHIDGFRSLQLVLPDLNELGDDKSIEPMQVEDPETDKKETSSPTKSFFCYQESLLALIEDAFTSSEISTHAGATSPLTSIVRIIPLLLEGFIRQTNAILTQKDNAKEKATKRKTANKKIVQLQFSFFAKLTAPMVRSTRHIQSSESETFAVILFSSLDDCLKLVLKYDVYLPSSDDAGDQNFVFLKAMSQHLIRFVSASDGASLRAVPVLAALLQLNHLIFHPTLTETISSCLILTNTEEDATRAPFEVVDFFCTIISTYRKLRQLDSMCGAVVKASSCLLDRKDASDLMSLSRLVQDDNVRSAFGEAVQSSPIQQTKQIVSDFNEWIVTTFATTSDDANYAALNAATSLVVGTFCLLLQNIRIDSSSALELRPLCSVIASSSIETLMAETRSLESVNFLGRQGILLCGWTIDLKNRCDFWLQNSRERDEEINESFRIPDAVTRILAEAIKAMSTNSMFSTNAAMEEIQFLACHRLEQLHASTHEKQRVAFATDAEEFGFALDLQETREIATFALKSLMGDNNEESQSFRRRWDNLARLIASWAPYVDDEDMKGFLSCFFARISDEKAGDDDATILLLRDASFLEIPKVHKCFGVAGFSVTARLIKRAVEGVSVYGVKLCDLAQAPGTHDWVTLGSAGMDEILERLITKTPTNQLFPEGSDHTLSGALHCLRLLNGLQGSVWDSGDASVDYYVESCLRLDYVCRCIASTRHKHQGLSIDLVASLRSTLSRLLEESGAAIKDSLSSSKFLSFLFHSTINTMKNIPVSSPARQNLLKSTGALIKHLFGSTPANNDLSEFVPLIMRLYQKDCISLGDPQRLILTSFGFSIISSLLKNEQSTKFDGARDIIDDICSCVWNSAIAFTFGESNSDFQLRHASISFIAELLRNGTNSGLTTDSIETIGARLVESSRNVASSKSPNEDMEYISYLVACFASGNPAKEPRQLLFSIFAKANVVLPDIMHNVVCDLAMGMDTGELQEALRMLISVEDARSILLPRLQILRLIILNATSQEQMHAISVYSPQIFSLALGAITPNGNDDGVQQAVDLIQDMASNRDFMSMRERELCLIFAHIVGTMRTTVDTKTVSNTIFDSCFSIVSFMLQRFSKQLFQCIPSVINCLCVMLGQCLYAEVEDTVASDRANKFSRLCELLLPHGEVYKKHVLCLVVEFVEAMKRDMNPTLRASLAPALYCLFDILQQHETVQLNSMLDDMGRALLRTVHENYKKQHVYKGQ